MNNTPNAFSQVTTPVGSIIAFAGKIKTFPLDNTDSSGISPESYGWMVCDGSSLPVKEYTELYAALGDLYGSSGNGDASQFKLPDLRGVGLDTFNPTTAGPAIGSIHYLIKFTSRIPSVRS